MVRVGGLGPGGLGFYGYPEKNPNPFHQGILQEELLGGTVSQLLKAKERLKTPDLDASGRCDFLRGKLAVWTTWFIQEQNDDITPNGWISKGNSLLSKKSRLVKYYDLAKLSCVVEKSCSLNYCSRMECQNRFVATVPNERIWILQQLSLSNIARGTWKPLSNLTVWVSLFKWQCTSNDFIDFTISIPTMVFCFGAILNHMILVRITHRIHGILAYLHIFIYNLPLTIHSRCKFKQIYESHESHNPPNS